MIMRREVVTKEEMMKAKKEIDQLIEMVETVMMM